LPSKDKLLLEIKLTDAGKAAAQKRILLQYNFSDQHKGSISLWDVYQRQNVQGRNEIHNRNTDFTQQQAREIVVHRFIDYWIATQSNLTEQDVKDIKKALTYKSYHDGFVTFIGIAADIHDDVQYLKDLAKKVTPAEVKSYYQHHKQDFKRIEKVKAQHITVADEKTANMIIEQLKKGAKFADLAKQFSMAMDKNTGGDLGWVVHNRNNPTWLSTLAFVQTVNVPSRPVRTPNGQWEILLITAKEEGYQPADSESVRYLASQVIARQKMVKEYQTIRKNLIQQADIHISPILKQEMINLEKDVMIAKPSEEDHHHH
ncbi:MAG TPA: peptidylprolyl isomerase, partial [Agitococcus sp.]|nr:peptidylprolyl isomerase [Agitococcus sp.]